MYFAVLGDPHHCKLLHQSWTHHKHTLQKAHGPPDWCCRAHRGPGDPPPPSAMALRGLARALPGLRSAAFPLGAAFSASAAASAGPAAAVYDHLVRVTVMDKHGVSKEVQGMEGQKLSEVLLEHSEFEGMCAPTPSGRGALDYHVVVARDFLRMLPERTADEELNLEDLSLNPGQNSRLGSVIKLSKELDGLTVALGDIRPWETI
ncbi:unnamed protein product [Ostreobium quekettii]|uniref:Uncharacterized protein n=1 Tax=Ostreobium quekettii TaxID=121088 RepID=A0A8S1ITS0_9CHLO|nr:unnamed protein product [Ostreobium quekettii]|eukprot:evm.model.scf_210.10 EVM.evm.TU.scf_210.10   scf_210:111988-113261(-)